MKKTLKRGHVLQDVYHAKSENLNFYMIPWVEDTPFKIASEHILNFYQGELDQEQRRYSVFVEPFYSLFEYSLSSSTYGVYHNIIFIRPRPEGLWVACDCGWKGKGICEHAASMLHQCIPQDDNFYFSPLYDSELMNLSPGQKEMLRVEVNQNHVRLALRVSSHPKFGLFFNLKTDSMNRADAWYYSAQPYSHLCLHVEPVSPVDFVIPIRSYIVGNHYVLPFEGLDYFPKPSVKSYLFDEDSQKERHLASHDAYWENLCRQMVALRDKDLPLHTAIVDTVDVLDFDRFERQHMLLLYWRKMLSCPDKSFRAYLWDSFSDVYLPRTVRLTKHDRLVAVDLRLAAGDLKVEVHCEEGPEYVTLRFQIYYKGVRVDKPQFYGADTSYLMKLEGDNVLYVDDVDLEQIIQAARTNNYAITVTSSEFEVFCKTVLRSIATRYPVYFQNEPAANHFRKLRPNKPTVDVQIRYIEGYVTIEPMVTYPGFHAERLGGDANKVFAYRGEEVVYIERNKEAEMAVDTLIRSFDPDLAEQQHEGFWQLPELKIYYTPWLDGFILALENSGCNVDLLDIKRGTKMLPRALTWTLIDVELDPIDGRIRFNIDVNFGGESISMAEFENIVLGKADVVVTVGSEYAFMRTRDRLLFKPILLASEFEGETFVLTSLQHFALQGLLKRVDPALVSAQVQELWNNYSKGDDPLEFNVPATLQGTLRSYQLEGVQWLLHLQRLKWGGILADDMGLGKTIQVIALLEHYYEQQPQGKPSLIAIPTSLLFNWNNEYQKFAPDRKTYVYHGADRHEITEFDPGSIVLTSYGMLMGHDDLLSSTSFGYLVMDESQQLKNRSSKRHKGLVAVIADHRVAMTGTPIENGISDLYAQMSLVNPDLFTNYATFNKMYKDSQQEQGVQEGINRLRETVQPFILRRTKKKVAEELPEKTETVLYMDMLPKQQKIYDKYKKMYKVEIQENMSGRDASKAKFVALEALTKLRQICASPALLKDEGGVKESVKLSFIDEIVADVVPAHKVLIFSFFTSMLKLVQEQLEASDIPFAFLEGSMRLEARQDAVTKFQENDDCRIFLISLKAGGIGLNLTAANYVYILDPWWNPAAEAQAIDRCYRIGQTKHVNAYKIVCRNSVEEKILDLQNRKKQLADDLIPDEKSMLKGLSVDAILELFE